MNTLKLPKSFAQDCVGKKDPDLARSYGVSTNTIRNWKARLGINLVAGNKIDYEPVDKMLRDGVHIKVIAEHFGIAESTTKRRRSLLFGPKFKVERKGGKPGENTVAITILPRDRYRAAIEAKARNLDMDPEKFRMNWLPTPTGRQWASDMAFMGAER